MGGAWTCRLWQRAYESPYTGSQVVLGQRERIGPGVVQEVDPLALSYPRNSRILNSIWLSKLLRRDVFQGRSIGSSSIYILVYFPLMVYGLTNVRGDPGLESRIG